jgi:hypothetical protein
VVAPDVPLKSDGVSAAEQSDIRASSGDSLTRSRRGEGALQISRFGQFQVAFWSAR